MSSLPMSSSVLRDVLQRQAPWWVAALPVAKECSEKAAFCLTSAQRRQVAAMVTRNGAYDERARMQSIMCSPAGVSPIAVQAALTHGRTLRLVNSNRGDVVVHVDSADFLSCEGTALTTATDTLTALTARTRTAGFVLPFWVSASEAAELGSYGAVRRRTGFIAPVPAGGLQAFEDPAIFVEVRDATAAAAPSQPTRYVNWESLCRGVTGSALLPFCLSYFRCFTPINVRTKRPFPRSVAVRLRVEAISSDCWCSIWGTAEDYDKCGFQVLDGALGVDVFDDLGNPAFLIHALCTTTPLDVYAACYPNDSICAG